MTKKRILITGGTGFLGKYLAIELKQHYEIWLTGRNYAQNLQAAQTTGCAVLPMELSHRERVNEVFAQVKPHIVIHAAAAKFVHLAEVFPTDYVDTNLLGSSHIAQAAIDHGVQTVVGISTDKATPPVFNLYGLTKALMERMFCNLNLTQPTRFTTVRFGNIFWASGSVLDIWRKCLAKNAPLPMVNLPTRRFYFTVGEAIHLIRMAFEQIGHTAGAVLTCPMQVVDFQDLQQAWANTWGGHFDPIAPRIGDSADEWLIGETELDFTTRWFIDNHPYYLIDPHKKAQTALEEPLFTLNAPMFSSETLQQLLRNPLES